jgi:hypothetical protein
MSGISSIKGSFNVDIFCSQLAMDKEEPLCYTSIYD